MKTKHICALFVKFCAAALVVCASTDRRVSESSFAEKNLQRDEAPSLAEVSPLAIVHERAFQKMDLNADGAVTLDEWQHFDASAVAKENLSTLDENGDGQINVTAFLKQALKHPTGLPPL